MPVPVTDEGLLSLIDRLPDPVLIADDARRYIYANDAACALFGLSSAGLLGKRIDDFLDSELLPHIEPQWRSFLDSGVQSGPFRLIRPDREIRDVEFTAVAGIRPGAHISFLRDVTAQRLADRARFESQRLAELALDAGCMGSWVWKSETGQFNWSQALEEIYGMSPAESARGYEAFLARLHPEDSSAVRQTIGETLRIGSHYQLEYRIVRTDGPVRWIADRGQVLLESDRRVGLAGVCWDITKSKCMEQESADHARELARSNADLRRFAYVASHDLKEPLRNVGALSQLLARQISGKLNGEEMEMLSLITGGAKRMAELIDSLLAYSQVSSNRDITLIEASAEDLLTESLNNLRLSIEQTRAEINREPLPRVRCSPVEIVQVLQNLIGNAIKYCGHRTPSIHVSAEERGGEWVFRIRDNGIGINPRYQEQIFEVFKRLHGQEYAGTGVGLAICKAIVEKHRGHIGVESEEGKGSVFYFSLPQ
ncbi:MAG: ATP-binding protein [Acidobacteriota bacterium]|nr:ATP-binding protein [Acidobacteriota bacterium]